MEDVSMILILAGVFGMFYFWKKDKKKRNIAAIITIISFVIFGFSTDPIESEIESEDVTEEQDVTAEDTDPIESEIESEDVTEEQDVTAEDVVEETNYEYKIVEQEFTQLGDFNRLTLWVSTPEEPNKDQIEQLLKQLENEVEENNADYNTEKDDLYIFLFENEIIANEGYTLGRLKRQDGVTEIDARQKDWDEQPNIEEYELYVEFMDKAIELETKAIEEDEDAFIEDNEIAEKVAENKDIDAETVLDSVSKVIIFMFMNQE